MRHRLRPWLEYLEDVARDVRYALRCHAESRREPVPHEWCASQRGWGRDWRDRAGSDDLGWRAG